MGFWVILMGVGMGGGGLSYATPKQQLYAAEPAKGGVASVQVKG